MNWQKLATYIPSYYRHHQLRVKQNNEYLLSGMDESVGLFYRINGTSPVDEDSETSDSTTATSNRGEQNCLIDLLLFYVHHDGTTQDLFEETGLEMERPWTHILIAHPTSIFR